MKVYCCYEQLNKCDGLGPMHFDRVVSSLESAIEWTKTVSGIMGYRDHFSSSWLISINPPNRVWVAGSWKIEERELED